MGAGIVRATERDRGIGSQLLLPEVLSKPMRTEPGSAVVAELTRLLSRLELLPVDREVAQLSVTLGAKYGLRAADAVHLATAITAGADRFLTNNHKDFSDRISEIDVVHPDELR
jgi:predicted nucleic acid-binding protein